MTKSAFVIFDDARAGVTTLFTDHVAIIEARDARDVAPALRALQLALDAGHYLAGYFSYEMGYALEPRLAHLLPASRTLPLLWFGVFAEVPRPIDPDNWLGQGRAYAGPLAFEWDQSAYDARFVAAKRAIAAGDIYQVNLSMRARFQFVGDPCALYRTLRTQAGAAHGAFVDDGEHRILSFSPELFFEIDASRGIVAKPMKGTAARDSDPSIDAALRARLAVDAKERAENVMIVDLIRNDIGRIAENGSVAVRDLFTIESFPTVHQMVSTVSARLRPAQSVAAIVAALFPCGSVTGAPKIRAMEFIRGLEQSARGAYCGAIGHFAPDGSARFNVAIRTLTLRDGQGELGVGSAIVDDSCSEAEYAECLLKARHVAHSRRPLRLIETLRWEGGYFTRLDRHLDRMQASAREFGIRFDQKAAHASLLAALAGSHVEGAWRVRLTLEESGRFEASATALTEENGWRYLVSDAVLASDDPLLRHKTDWRDVYDAQHALALRAGCDEIILLNQRGELCEGSRSNLFLVRGGAMFTPARASGGLPGCLRAELIERGECREAILTLADLATSDAVYFGNSLRGLVRGLPHARAFDAIPRQASATSMMSSRA